MTLALTILFSILVIGVLIRGYFARIMPFDILKHSLLLMPGMLRRKWPIVLTLYLIVFLTPLVSILIRSSPVPQLARFALTMAWQALTVAMLALAAIRIHRTLVLREGGAGFRFGKRELRMVSFVLAAWCVYSLVNLSPLIIQGLGIGLLTRGATALAPVASWLMLLLFAYIGTSVSFDAQSPLRATVGTVRKEISATATLLLVCQGLSALTGLAVTTSLQLTGAPFALVVAGALVSAAVYVAVFVVSELSIAIGFTRINVGIYDDTTSRDYNAEWV